MEKTPEGQPKEGLHRRRVIIFLCGLIAVIIAIGVWQVTVFLQRGGWANLAVKTFKNINSPLNNFDRPKPGEIVPIPDLYVARRDGVFHVAYNKTTEQYSEPVPFAKVTDVIKMNTTRDSVFLYRPDSVERRSHDGRLINTWTRSASKTYSTPTEKELRDGIESAMKLQTAVYNDGKIYVAANRSMIILDENLNELGVVEPLPQTEYFGYKTIDDILVVDTYAFLVDDIASPLFVFSVDISDPTKPKRIRTIGVGGVYGTITNQWYNHQRNEWCFHRSTSSGYSGQDFSVICAAKSLYTSVGETGSEGYLEGEVPGLTIYEVGHQDVNSDSQTNGTGYEFLRDLNRNDDFVLIQAQDKSTTYIAGLSGTYTIEAKMDVGDFLSRANPYFYRYAGYIYLYAMETLNVFEDDGVHLTGRFSQNIPFVEVPRTNGYSGTSQMPAWTTFAADPRLAENP